MKRSFVSIIVVFVLSFLPSKSEAQVNLLNGYVTTFDSIPLVNVKIIVSSSEFTVFTDSIGRFQLNCLSKDKLKISAKGFITQKVKIEDENELLHVNLILKSGARNPEIAVGYGHVKDKDKLFSMVTLNEDDERFSQFSNMYDLIDGRFAGVEVNNKQVIVRGQNSFTGSSAALIVVDGMIVDQRALEMLRPSDVKSINLLKDGATAFYGSRGASGVVVIETKGGGN